MAEQYYTRSDFKNVRKIDAHVHYNSLSKSLTNLAEECNFRLLSINTFIPGFPGIKQQQAYVVDHTAYQKRLFHLTSFDSVEVFVDNWLEDQLKYVNESMAKGALGFKVWKDIGMTLRNAKGDFIFIDDELFKPFFDLAEEKSLPVLGHIGEPRNCWLPLEQMTVNNDKNYFSQHPEFHMHLHPEYPSYDRLVQSYERMVGQHPKLHYTGAHFGSLEWSTEEVGKRLDKFPNMTVDTAERIAHMQYQTAKNREQVRDFFINYQDRIIYGTDIIVDDKGDFDALTQRSREIWENDWRYFVTDDELTSALVNEPFRGLKLPAKVVDKLYHSNAVNTYKLPA